MRRNRFGVAVVATTRRALLLAAVMLLATVPPAAAGHGEGRNLPLSDPVTVRAAAVVRTDGGLEGTTADLQVTVARNGSGHIFMDTVPLTQVDMQGSARLAVRVAHGLTGLDRDDYDHFFVVRSESSIIGGPSAGATLTVGTVAALKGWSVDEDVLMTGTITPDGSVGAVGGIPEKARAAWAAGARLFLYPDGQSNTTTGAGERVHLPTWCQEEVGIRCRPVAEIGEAVRLMTGHEFREPEPPGNVTDERYRQLLRPLARELLDRANRTIDDASSARTEADLPPDLDLRLRERETQARQTRTDAVRSFHDRKYYTTASRAFQATVQARGVLEVAEAWMADRPNRHIEDRFQAADQRIVDVSDQAGSATAEGLSELQAVGAAQSRAIEARNQLQQARATYTQGASNNAIVQAMDALAFSLERANTVEWWLQIGEAFSGGPTFPDDRLERAAQEVRTSTRETLSYARVLLQRDGSDPPPALQRASELLSSSGTAMERGFLPAAIYDALQAETWVSVALTAQGVTSEGMAEKVNRSRDRAGVAIAGSRAVGVEPILAVAYYEFAGELDQPVSQMAFYGFARTIAQSTGILIDTESEPRESRFLGPAPGLKSPVIRADDLLGVFAISLVLGVGIGLAATGPKRPRSSRRRGDDGR